MSFKDGYRAFGSFHTEKSVEELIKDQIVDGNNLFNTPVSDAVYALRDPDAMRNHHFLVDFDSWCFINHGAFGAPLAAAQHHSNLWRSHAETQPLSFLDRQLFPQLCRVIRQLAKYLNTSPDQLALLPNATTGLNAAISSYKTSQTLTSTDVIFSLDIGYGSVKKMLQDLSQSTGAQYIQLTVQFPITSPQDIFSQVEAALPPNTKLAIFDVITSNTSILLPYIELCQLCKSRNIDVILDGAHAPGAITDLNLHQLQPVCDFFIGNCHKWLCAPRGVGFLWVHPSHKRHTRPLVISHGWGSGFSSEWIWDGNRDYSNYLGLAVALSFWEEVGTAVIHEVQRTLLKTAVQILIDTWRGRKDDEDVTNTSWTLVPLDTMCPPGMCVVKLPRYTWPRLESGNIDDIHDGDKKQVEATSTHAKRLQDWLHFKHRIEVPIKCLLGQLWVRISVHLYNKIGDYEKLAHAVFQYDCDL
jgi:isopenicillin-N epimerase